MSPNPEENGFRAQVADTVQTVKTEASNLWQAAYDHPVQTAAVVGGVALGAAAIYATRGQIARSAARDVLLIEDTPYMGQAFKTALEANGEKVTWFTGVKRAAPLTGITAEGREMVFNPRNYKVAFVDGELTGSYLQGEHVVHALKQGGLKSIGTSSVAAVNRTMLDNGATIAAPKSTVLSALIENQINLSRVGSAPGGVQTGLNTLTEMLKGTGGKALRQKGDNLLMKCIQDAGT